MSELHFECEGWHCHLYEATEAAPLVVMPLLEGDGASVWQACAKEGGTPFHLLAVYHAGWNDIYAPWPLQSPFDTAVCFKGQGAQTLKMLCEHVIPQAEAHLTQAATMRVLVGYSMAGLFALYGCLATDYFQAGASVSGSLWAPEVTDFVQVQLPSKTLARFYVSLGSKERKTRNPLLAPLEVQSKAVVDCLEKAHIQTTFAINPGNHFHDPEGRMAKAILWLIDKK